MPNIDEKVVKMTFDNQQFEKGVSESLKTIDDLKKALEFDKLGESLKGLESLSTTINNSLNDISNSVKKVENVFTPLGKIVNKELDKIADKVTDTTNKFAKMVTGIEGFNAGYSKYNNYTKAVQTITNATGKSVDDVSKVLDVLAKYTDETSYDFAEMVSSIGKFTSVGIELERAEAAMEGIANWAAKSGAGKQQANQAMYNISQAMGAGAMKKQDWNSIVNANMATKEFKETAIETAIEMGVITKETGINFQNFDETLSNGWLSSEVLTEVLAKYADQSTIFGQEAFKAAQEALTLEDAIEAVKDAVSSNWMNVIKAGLGDLDEARSLMTDIANNIIDLSSEFTSYFVDLAEGWHEIGGYNTMIEAGTNIWEAFMNIVLGVKEALTDVFPPATAENLVAITNDIKKATDDLRAAFGIDTEIEVTDKVTKTINKATELVQSLKQGDNNRYVKELQNWLVQYGYLDKGQADGIYGPSTVEAVKKLQKSIGVDVTGKWDEATRAAAAANKKFNEEIETEVTRTLTNAEEVTETYEATINIAKNLNKTLKKGDNNKQVKTLQKVLHKMGLLDKQQANGIFGPETEEAIKKLQQKYGVEVTGMWDDQTRAVAQTKDAFKEVVEKERIVYKETEGLTGPMKRLQEIIKGISSVVATVFDIFKAGFEIVKAVFSVFDPLVQVFGRAAGMFANMFTNFHEAIEDGDIIPQWAQNVITFLGPVAEVIDNIAFALDAFITSYAKFLQAYDLENTFGNFFGYLIGYLRQNTILGPVIEILGLVLKHVGKLAENIIGIVGGVIKWISDKIRSVVGNNGLGKAISESEKNNGIISALINIYVTIKYIIGLIIGFIGNAFATIFGNGSALAEGNKEAESNGIVTFLNGLATVLKVAANIISIGLILVAYGLTMLFGAISKYVTPIINGIGQIFSGVISDFNEGKIKSIPDFFNSLWNSFKNADAGKFLIETFEKVKKAISDFFDYIRYVFTPDENGNFNFAEKLKPALEKLNPVISLFESIKERFSKAWNNFMGIGSTDDVTESKGFVSVLDKVVEFFKKTVPNIIPKLIGPAIAAFATFSLFKGAKALKNISDTLDNGGILGILTGNGNNDDDEDGIADKALKIAGAIAAITASIGVLALIDAGKALKGIVLFGVVLAAMTGAAILLKKFEADKVDIGGSVLKLAAGIGVLVLSLAALNGIIQANMNDKGELNKGFITALEIIAGMVVALGIIEIAIATLHKGESGGVSGVLDMCLGIMVLVLALGQLSDIVKNNMNDKGELNKGFITALEIIAGMVVALGIIEIALNYQTSKFKAGKSKTKISGVLGLAAAVYVLVLAFEKMIKVVKKSGMEESELNQVFGGIEIMVLTLGAIAVLLGTFSKEGISTLGTAAELLAMGLMTKMVVGAFAEAILMTKGADPELMKIFFIGVETALGVLTGIVEIFGHMPVETFIGEAGLLGLLGVITAGIDMISGVTATAMDRFAGGLMQVGEALKYFGDDADQMNWDAINRVWEWIKDSLPTLIKDFVSLQGDVATASNMAMDLWSFGYALFLYSDIISKVGDEGIKGTQEAYEMAVWAKEVADYIETITMPQDVMNGNLTFLAGHLLLYSNLMDDVSNNSSQNAIDLVTDAKTIADKINEVKINDGYESAKALVALGVAIKLYYQSLSKVGKTDVFDQPLAEGEKFDPSDVVVDTDTIKRAFEALADAIPDKDTVNLLSGMKEGGDYDMIDASLGIGALGEALEAYGNNLNVLTIGKVKAANLALKGITDLDTHIKETKVVESDQYIAGNSENITQFSGHIVTLGGALETYGTFIKDLDKDQIEHANTILEEFAKLDQQLNRNDNFWTDIWGLFGDTTTDTIKSFGQKFVAFTSGIFGVHYDNNAVNEYAQIGKDLGLVKDPLGLIKQNAVKGASSANGASNNLTKLGSSIGQVGQSLSNYNLSIADLNEEKTKLATEVLRTFADLAEVLPKSGVLYNLFNGQAQSLQTFSTGFESVGKGLVAFQTGAEGLDVDKLELVMTTIERIISWGKEFDDNIYNPNNDSLAFTMKFERMAEGIANSIESLARIATGKELFEQEVEAPAITVFASLGDTLTSALTSGISTGSNVDTNVTTAISEVIGKIQTEVESYDTQFYNIGEYIAKGIISGVVGSFDLVSKVFEALGLKAMVEPTQEAVEVNSPSRKFKWIAQMCALGLKYGFEDYSYLVEDATLDLANSSLNTIAAAFDESRVADAGQGALDGLKSVLLSTKAPEKIKKMMSDILVGAGYLKESDVSNVEAYANAIKKYKEEVLGDENATATWGYADSIKLWNTVSRTLGKNNSYNALEYEKEMLDSLGAKYDEVIGQKTKLLGSKMQNKYGVGNVDLTKRLKISPEAMKAAGYTDFDGDYATLYSMTYTAGDNKKITKDAKKLAKTYDNLMIEAYKSGNSELAKEYEKLSKEAKEQAKLNAFDYQYDSNVIIDMTPILPDGSVLSQEGLEAYLDTLLESGRDILEADDKKNGGLGLVLRVDNVDAYASLSDAIKEDDKWMTDLHDDQERYFNSLEKEKKQLQELGEYYDDYIIKRHEVLRDANGKEVGFVNYDTKNKKHMYLTKEMEAAGYEITKDKNGNDVITNSAKEKKDELERIKYLQEVAERRGYLRKDSYTSGVMDTATIVAMNALEKDLYGKSNKTTKWTAKDQKKLVKAIEDFGSEDKLFEAKIGSKVKPEAFLDEMDKRIEKQVAEDQKRAEDTYTMQQILEAYGYLGTNHYTPGVNGKITNSAAAKFRKEILGESGTDLKYGPLTDEEMAHLSEVIDQYGDETAMLKALSGNDVKKQKKLNDEGNEELSKLLSIYGENADIKHKTTTDKNGKAYTRYGLTKKGEVTALQEIMEKYGFLASGTYKEGKSDKTTKEAWKNFQEFLFGVAKNYAGDIKLDKFQQDRLLQMLTEYGGWDKLVSKKQKNKPASRNTGVSMEEWMFGSVYSENALDSNSTISTIWQYADSIESELTTRADDLKKKLLGDGENSTISQLEDLAKSKIEEIKESVVGNAAGILVGDKSIDDLFTSEEAQNGVKESSKTLFSNIPKGAVEAIEEGKAGFQSALEGMAEAGQETTQETEDMHSPSQVYYEYGQLLIQGLINGVNSKSDDLKLAITNACNNAYVGAQLALIGLNNAINSSDVATPKIRPIIEASNDQSGSGYMLRSGNGYTDPLSQITTSINGVQTIAAGMQTNVQEMKKSIDDSNTAIIQQFTALNSHLDDIDKDILNMKIYLDSDNLVAGTVTKMGRALGRRQFVASRQ